MPPFPDEPAGFDLGPDGVPHQGQIVVSPEKAENGVLRQVVDIEPRQADLGFSRHGRERFQGQGQTADHLLLHLGRVGKDIRHRNEARPRGLDEPVDIFQVADVLLHDDEGDPDVDPARSPPVELLEALEARNDGLETRSLADVLEARLRDAVERDPEPVQAALHQARKHGVIEARAVGDHLDPDAQVLHDPDHAQDVRMDRRFPETAEHDGIKMGKSPEPVHQPVERRGIHVPHRLLPGLPDADLAGQVAARRRLDVDPGQAVDVGPDLDPGRPPR